MRAVKLVKQYFTVFPLVMTCISLGAAAYIELFWHTDTSSGASLIWQLALCSFLCAFTSFCGNTRDGRELSKRALLIRMVLCFLYVNAVVMGCGFAFDWFHAEDWRMLLGMELTICAVFAAVTAILYCHAKRDAARVNEKLKGRA
ncbi:MAG: DUF3021 family protein [Eubacteriales bacterium]|nr:DUF3021 family protein [Eubacteriales bacterium]